ncbi:outer membrane protein with beta-barrel domain [Chryseobacterium sp. 52]|uniref:outer membrane beta-barrel protein n=1 Tax=Chryseobacterium sp. 52 TaxID=2035213 RepID=UPI000C1757A0|nr:outer membrane beta-barrel protein [Chryseobacterium sp. 52]PIF43683.1 outer membrane protein with beta-barrel domain [Chryseobacterium sp. 52]
MNNRWLNDLHRKMEDHEEDIPDGLWDDIKDEIFSEEEENRVFGGIMMSGDHNQEEEKAASAGRGRPILYRIGGIAAAIAMLFFTGKFLLEMNAEDVRPQITDRSKKENNINEINTKSTEPVKIEANTNEEIKTEFSGKYSNLKNGMAEKSIIDKIFNNIAGREINRQNGTSESLLNEKGQNLLTKENPALNNHSSVNENPVLKEKTEEILNQKENILPEKYADNEKPKLPGRQSKKWMLSLLTGNVSSNSSEQKFPGYASISGSPMAFSDFWSSGTESDPLTELLLANQSKEVEARIRHKIPVTFGLSMYYNLGKRWGIGTGISYTKLTSELHSGSNSNYIKGNQSIHYIGIPVQVNYNVIQKGRFTGYVTGGILAEKAVAGKLSTKYIVNDQVTETQEERLDVKPVQFSVNSAIGLQVKIIDKIGIYAEPGIGYHFKNDSQLNTLYKDQPLNFNMKFGIRVLLD